jgi:GcrA cell cycle regulator
MANDAPIHNEHTCSLLELSAEKCRWPISSRGAEDFCFCGNTPIDGLPYWPATPGSPIAQARGNASRGGERWAIAQQRPRGKAPELLPSRWDAPMPRSVAQCPTRNSATRSGAHP